MTGSETISADIIATWDTAPAALAIALANEQRRTIVVAHFGFLDPDKNPADPIPSDSDLARDESFAAFSSQLNLPDWIIAHLPSEIGGFTGINMTSVNTFDEGFGGILLLVMGLVLMSMPLLISLLWKWIELQKKRVFLASRHLVDSAPAFHPPPVPPSPGRVR